jgi:hypothetical protein
MSEVEVEDLLDLSAVRLRRIVICIARMASLALSRMCPSSLRADEVADSGPGCADSASA